MTKKSQADGASAGDLSFEYVSARVRDLRAHTVKRGNRTVVDQVDVGDRKFQPSKRFWTSFYARHGFGDNMFKWWDHHEVFQRIAERAPNDELQITIEHNGDKSTGGGESDGSTNGRLLGVCSPKAKVVEYAGLIDLLGRYGVTGGVKLERNAPRQLGGNTGGLSPRGLNHGDTLTSHHPLSDTAPDGGAKTIDQVPTLSYVDGVVRSVHIPRTDSWYAIAGDNYANRFIVDTPIDGYGKPSIYLMLLREICTNHAIGYAKSFRQDISTGKKEDNFNYALVRAFEGYNNEEGFKALADRFDAAGKSFASINEVTRSYKLLTKLHFNEAVKVDSRYLTDEKRSFREEKSNPLNAAGGDGNSLMEGSPIIKSFHAMVGDLTKVYGLSNLDALSQRRQRTLPAGCKVYELLNFLSETATHYATPAGSQLLQAEVGTLISNEYDLEGTAAEFSDWKDFFVTSKDAQNAMAGVKTK